MLWTAACRPVLVGTRTVKDSEYLAGRLAAAGLNASVLNALQDREEALIIEYAGSPGQITVATNMAGRGTDIKITPEVAASGGLAVIATERHDAGRIDRQLFGRCGRQGDPGTFEVFVSLEDELLESNPVRIFGVLGHGWANPERPFGKALGRVLFRSTQRSAERQNSHIRKTLLRVDESLDSALAFTGVGE